jgi:hypothetical protein
VMTFANFAIVKAVAIITGKPKQGKQAKGI